MEQTEKILDELLNRAGETTESLALQMARARIIKDVLYLVIIIAIMTIAFVVAARTAEEWRDTYDDVVIIPLVLVSVIAVVLIGGLLGDLIEWKIAPVGRFLQTILQGAH